MNRTDHLGVQGKNDLIRKLNNIAREMDSEKKKVEDEYDGTSSQEWTSSSDIEEGSFYRIGRYLWNRDR